MKKSVEQPKIITESDQKAASQVVVSGGGRKHVLRDHKKLVILSVLVILLAAVVGGAAYAYGSHFLLGTTAADRETNEMSKALQANNKDQALEHAQQALRETPNDLQRVNAVATLTKEKNPNDAKQYYARALNIFKKENNLDDPSKKQTAITYRAAGSLAENAGYTDQAKQYYEQAIKAANQSDSYEKHVAQQAQDALKRLQ